MTHHYDSSLYLVDSHRDVDVVIIGIGIGNDVGTSLCNPATGIASLIKTVNATACASTFTKVDKTLKLLDTKFEAAIIKDLVRTVLVARAALGARTVLVARAALGARAALVRYS